MKAKFSVSSNKNLYEIRRIWPSWMLGGTSACSWGCWHHFAPSIFGRRPAPKAGTFSIEFRNHMSVILEELVKSPASKGNSRWIVLSNLGPNPWQNWFSLRLGRRVRLMLPDPEFFDKSLRVHNWIFAMNILGVFWKHWKFLSSEHLVLESWRIWEPRSCCRPTPPAHHDLV